MVENYTPMSRADVIRAVERRCPSRIPLVHAHWWGEGLCEQYGDALHTFDRYPEDVVHILAENPVNPSRMNLPWEWQKEGNAHDAKCVIDDWAKLDDFIASLPRPETDPLFEQYLEKAQKAHAADMYILFGWWSLFYETGWSLRGMVNLLCDYVMSPDEVHRLYDAMCETYCAYIRHAHACIQPDGFFTSDDLGHQTGPMMGADMFEALLAPYYQRVGTTLKSCDMHFWLHSCGDNTVLLPGLIAAGVDVFHPVQKHTMDAAEVAKKYGDRLTFLAGIDVQHVLQECDPEGVRKEVRYLIDTFDRVDGGMCIAAGNGIVAGTPLANIEAFLDEAVIYGAQHRGAYAAD